MTNTAHQLEQCFSTKEEAESLVAEFQKRLQFLKDNGASAERLAEEQHKGWIAVLKLSGIDKIARPGMLATFEAELKSDPPAFSYLSVYAVTRECLLRCSQALREEAVNLW